MIAGHWVPELVRIAGGEPLLSATGAASKTIDLDALIAAAPDVVVVQACGFDLETTRAAWAARPELARRLASTPTKPPRVFLTDGATYFNRPGPRLVESAELLAALLHGGDRSGIAADALAEVVLTRETA